MRFPLKCLNIVLPTLLLVSIPLPLTAQVSSSNEISASSIEVNQLFQQGNELFSNGQYGEAIAIFQQVLALRRNAGDLSGEAEALHKIGAAYDYLSEYRPALEFYQQALAIRERIGDRAGQGTTLNSIGVVYQAMGNYSQALSLFQRSLIKRREVGDKAGEGRTLSNIGLVYENQGQYSQALLYYQQALEIAKTIDNRFSIAALLNNMGGIHAQLGQYSPAMVSYQQALEIRKEIGDRVGIGTTLHNIGYLYDRQEQYAQARQFYQQALTVRQQINDRPGIGTTLNNLGLVYDNLGQSDRGLQMLKQALELFQELGDRASIGNTFDSLGTVYKSLRQYPQALDAYQQALTMLKEIGNRPIERVTLGNIARVLEAQNQPALAIVFYKASVNLTEAIRQDLRTLTREQQQSYTATVADTYRALADLLLKQNRVLEAQQVLDLLKVQELDEYLHNVRGNNQTSQGVDSLPQEQKIQTNYAAIQTKAIELGKELNQLQKIPTANRTSEQQQRINEIVELQQQIRAEFNNFINQPEVVALTRQLSQTTSGENINLRTLNKLQSQLQKLQQNAVLLYPLILEDRLELVLVTGYSPPIRRTVNVKRQDVNQLILEFRRSLQDSSADAKPIAVKLYELLIKPIENDLNQAKAETIIYAPDGQLRYIPLAALSDGKQWLVERYRINNITSASLTDFNTKPSNQPSVLAAAFTQGNFTFSVGTRQFSFAGLPFAKREVENLAAIIPNTTKLLDKDFTPKNTVSRLNEYSIIHLATHAEFVMGKPEDSFILFGDGSRVTLRDVETWSLPNVELVVLSACKTGVGGQLGNGEEILGFGYQIQLTGAKAAIASLWAVSDGGTQALMDSFYTALEGGNITKAEALRQAQIALITGSFQSGSQPSNRLSHPYYWAPFILIGNGL